MTILDVRSDTFLSRIGGVLPSSPASAGPLSERQQPPAVQPRATPGRDVLPVPGAAAPRRRTVSEGRRRLRQRRRAAAGSAGAPLPPPRARWRARAPAFEARGGHLQASQIPEALQGPSKPRESSLPGQVSLSWTFLGRRNAVWLLRYAYDKHITNSKHNVLIAFLVLTICCQVAVIRQILRHVSYGVIIPRQTDAT